MGSLYQSTSPQQRQSRHRGFSSHRTSLIISTTMVLVIKLQKCVPRDEATAQLNRFSKHQSSERFLRVGFLKRWEESHVTSSVSLDFFWTPSIEDPGRSETSATVARTSLRCFDVWYTLYILSDASAETARVAHSRGWRSS